jgi:hypothetical protein
LKKPLVSLNVLTAKKNTKGVFTSGFILAIAAGREDIKSWIK